MYRRTPYSHLQRLTDTLKDTGYVLVDFALQYSSPAPSYIQHVVHEAKKLKELYTDLKEGNLEKIVRR